MPKRAKTIKKRSEGFLLGNRFMFKTKNMYGSNFRKNPFIFDRKKGDVVENLKIRRAK